MTIRINGQEINAQLEQEKNLGDLLWSLEEWLESTGFSISSIAVNTQLIPAEQVEQESMRATDTIEILDINASSWADLLAQALQITDSYLNTTDDIKAQYTEWQKNPAARFLQGRDPQLFTTIQAAFESQTESDRQLLRNTISEMITELSQPLDVLIGISTMMEKMADRLENIPLELQTGKDVSAATTLHDFTLLFEKIVRLMPVLRLNGIELESASVEDKDFKMCMTELNEAIKEVLEAYSKGDAILVGDLSEYELAPRIRSLAPTIAKIAAA